MESRVKSWGAFGALLLAAACGRPSPGSPPAAAPATSAARILQGQALERKNADVAELRGVTLDRFEGDRLRHRATIERAELDRVRGDVAGAGIRVELEGDDPQAPRAVATADRGRSTFASKLVILEGHVRVRDHTGRTLGAELLTYDFARDVADAPAPVTLDGANFHAEGGALHLDRVAGTAEVAGPATGLVRPKRRGR